MTVLIPMAGEGSRFLKEGYETPKPLLEVDGVPMVVKAVLDLPKSDRQIFICRDFHIKDHNLEERIKEFFPNAQIIVLDKLTQGQAETCLIAKEYLDPDEELVIGACDNGMIYDHNSFQERKQKYDVLSFTFRNNVTVLEKPNQYGWMITDSDGNIQDTSIKKAISDQPMNDHAVVGSFWFRKSSYFLDAAQNMISENRRINNEFYVDECMKDAVNLGLKTGVFEINNYICWGTPDDYKTYNYWKDFFSNQS